EHGFSFWRAGGEVLGGWSLAATGAAPDGVVMLRQGLDDWAATGSVTYRTYYLGLLAEGLAGQGPAAAEGARGVLEEALALAARTGEGLYEAELYRLRGEARLVCAGEPSEAALHEAEEDFRRALDVAGRQEAKALQLRAAMALACLARRRGRPE